MGLACYATRIIGGAPPSDFTTRRNASGVVYSNGFDSDSEYNEGTIDLAADSTNQWIRDTSQKTSGNSSARVKLRSGITTANIGGAWTKDLPDFVQGDDFYVQYRQRVDSQWITNTSRWNSSYKSINCHGSSNSCQSTEWVILLGENGTLRVNAYTNCGDGFNTSKIDNSYDPSCSSGGGDCLKQQASQLADAANVGYNCHYQNQFAGDGNGNGCLYWAGNVWYTLYMHVHLGNHGGSTGNTIDCYIASGGGPYLQWQRAADWPWVGGDNALNRLRLETYMTELPSDGLAALADGFAWFDELIVSRSPIAAPNN